jgi:GMP synthase (glutamine-hydrolysing)
MDFLNSSGLKPEVVAGYGYVNPLDKNPSHIILTGVPLNVDYSLAQPETQRVIEREFGWLQVCKCPVLGICYGHQILAHIFGGRVASLRWTVEEARFPLGWKADPESGIFSDIEYLEVFVEHKDYVLEAPPGFRVLCQIDQIPYIMFHPGKDIYGVQFVPERSDDRSKELLMRFIGSG